MASLIETFAKKISKEITSTSLHVEDIIKQESNVNFTSDRLNILILRQLINELNITPQQLYSDTNHIRKTIDVFV